MPRQIQAKSFIIAYERWITYTNRKGDLIIIKGLPTEHCQLRFSTLVKFGRENSASCRYFVWATKTRVFVNFCEYQAFFGMRPAYRKMINTADSHKRPYTGRSIN